MTTLSTPEGTPIEVWLSRQNMVIKCRVVRQDESTVELDVDSLSMRGAQREITGSLIRQGYAAVGRWETESYDDRVDEADETSRKFKVA